MAKHIDYKYCPQCQREFTVREGNPYCGHCDITIYHNVVAAASAMVVQDGQVLLTRRKREPKKGRYDIPGGFIEPGETARQATLRELKEETGLEGEIVELLGVYDDHYEDDTYTLGAHYIVKITAGTPTAGDDAASLEWVDLEDLPHELSQSFFNVRQSIHDLQAWHRSQGHN